MCLEFHANETQAQKLRIAKQTFLIPKTSPKHTLSNMKKYESDTLGLFYWNQPFVVGWVCWVFSCSTREKPVSIGLDDQPFKRIIGPQTRLLYLPNQMRFPTGRELVTCREQNSLTPSGEQNLLTPKGNSNLNFRLERDQVVLLKTAANLSVSRRQANDFFAFLFYFWVGRHNKTPYDWSLDLSDLLGEH